ncbi:hypothetical protein YERSI8AC_60102 [Enterobacterales bacterium 8AC]|nr:hypothetical protein YERSI8AC_60102 [Enterobacterales bacterium 8AC]
MANGSIDILLQISPDRLYLSGHPLFNEQKQLPFNHFLEGYFALLPIGDSCTLAISIR